MSNVQTLYSGVLLLQSLYYTVTGIWPLLSIGTFQKITGPKQDLWLVKTVGILVGVIGIVLAMTGLRRKTDTESLFLAVGSALGLASIDVIYVCKGRIARIYLLDAVAECGLASAAIITWLLASPNRKHK